MTLLFCSSEFVSTLPMGECVLRLKGKLGPSFSLFSSAAFSGSVIGRHVSIRKNISYRNSWQTVFVGHLSEVDSGTRLSGTFRMNAFVIVFMAIWFAGIGAGAITVVTKTPTDPVAVIPFGMLAFGVGLTAFGRYLARNEQSEISVFLCATLDARESGN